MTEAASFHEALFRHMPAGLHVYEVEGPADAPTLRLRAANPASLDLLGVGLDAILGQPIEQVFPGPGREDWPRRIAEAAQGAPVTFEDARDQGDMPGARTLLFKAFSLSEGRVALSFEDISERRREEEKARQNLTLLEQIVHHIPLAVFVKEAKTFRYLEMNPPGASLVGRRREDILGKTDFEVLPEDLAGRLREIDRRILAEGKVFEVPEETILHANQDVIIVRTIKVPIHDERGEPWLLLGISEDITERKRLAAVERSERELRENQERLRATIQDLLTPVLPIHDGVLVAPLVGHVDSQRSAQFTEALLEEILDHQAEIVILDITGVPLVDASVADHLLRAIRSAELLGAHCVVVGLSPQLAQTIVELGVDLGALVIQRDLQAGVAYALARQNSRAFRKNVKTRGDRSGSP
jgi:rsbT co-antagonist protein RsbR